MASKLLATQIVISDASPIRYLVEIGQVNLLRQLFGKVLLPEVVAGELTNDRTPLLVREWMSSPPAWIEIRPTVLEDKEDSELWSLDEGERRAILLALTLAADLVLMDERAGTLLARRLGLTVVGTLGILERSAERGLISLPEAIEKLHKTNFRISSALLKQILEAHALRQDRS